MTHNAKVTHAGWGAHVSHDNMANGVDGAQLSSCMTNQLGALESRFDYCDLNDLVGKLFQSHMKQFLMIIHDISLTLILM